MGGLDLQVVFINVMILFTLMFLGFMLGKRGVVSHSSIKDLNNILIDVSIPCMIVVSLIRPYSESLMGDTIKVLVLISIFHISMAIIAYYLTKFLKVDPYKRGSWIFAIVFSNNGFIGFPLMYALYGNDGMFIMAMGNIIQNVLIFSLGIKLVTMNQEVDEELNLRKIIFTKQNIAVIIGLIIFTLQLAIPEPVVRFLNYIASLTVPLSMMVVGLSLSRYDIKNMFKDKEAYRLTFLRMIIVPAVLVFIFKILRIDVNANLSLAIVFYTAALPSPAFTSIMAERYNGSVDFASKCVFITTVVSVLSVPFFAGLL